ncbi:MAG: hypothetical protein B7Y07_02010 [Halothiobacillus sp. 24-54-40]|jgi:hypothetical protein|nr:hypothetical protein [Halothiobacillaceae bacterium]OYY42523.1 MAG: hypothetical protein B7Y58_01615 [Halothiobacillus sp. 35-54-62]OYZ87927.1 MAG: hypothetical protein B7Y07_02010 [Halothiobacillus sp. 24-54-40]OZA81454.1 MAG: hypothetical protein B7X64_01745 [Halothiobacillus sp. 39-53-45]HQS02130.1 hypothetical protein [Halothiobacillus sp.]
MNPNIDDLHARIRALQEELEGEYRKSLDALEQKRTELAGQFKQQQKHYKMGLLRFIARSRPFVILTAPIIYLGWIPFFLLDVFVTVYQTLCFPIYRIPKVKRSDFVVFGRESLPYLNLIEKFNCLYCSYGNGVAAYVREISSRTEQYWCPIKYAKRIPQAHGRYSEFFDYGDGEAYRLGLARLRQAYEEEIKKSQ